ncbi:MAG: acyloxyacyl hydrolase [Parachlamydiales bacterium]
MVKRLILRAAFYLFIFSLPLGLGAFCPYLTLSGGVFDFLRERHRTGEIRLEYEAAASFCYFHPLLGALQTFKGASYLYGGLALDLPCSPLVVIPSISAGYYHEGGGKNLGFPLEFRSTLTLGFEVRTGARIGLQIAHISNAHLGHRNPGEETLSLVFSFPLKGIAQR